MLSLLLALFFFDILFLGKTLSTSSLLPGTTPDGPYEFSGYKPEMPFSFDTSGNAWINDPHPYLINRQLRDGVFPMWNSNEGLGMPMLGDPGKEILNPLKIFLNLFPSPLFNDLYFLLRLWVTGIFTFLFLRERRLSGTASLFGASFFMLCGYSVWWINLHPMSSIMFIPAFFYLYERWQNRGGRWSPFLLALSISLSIFGGKFPDTAMGLSLLFLYALCIGFSRERFKGLLFGGGRVLSAAVTGILLASVEVLPFLELYSKASPLSKAIRTGAASHTLPLISSVSLWQPLFLGWKNYFYSSWLQWQPQAMLPYSGVIILMLLIYVVLSRQLLMKTLPFAVFFLILFFQIFGLMPSGIAVNLPLFGSMNFIKYNSMLFFSLAVISATALDDLTKEEERGRRCCIALLLTAAAVFLYYYFLFREAPEHIKPYITGVLVVTLLVLLILGILYLLLKERRRVFAAAVFIAMASEMLIYMPKDHPDRAFPYKAPPYMEILKDAYPYRVAGDGDSVPPLVSNVLGLYDIRGIDLLIPNDYYLFFENLVSFSVPYTNNPDALLAATSPVSDLLGVKYILSRERLNPQRLEDAVRSHISSLRWIRLFKNMISHKISGWLRFGFFSKGEEKRFSFFFPLNFSYKVRAVIKEPYIFTGFTLKDAPEGVKCNIKITAGDIIKTFNVSGNDLWKDAWIDLSAYSGKDILISIEGTGTGAGEVVLGNFGFSKGRDIEDALYDKLSGLHKKELSFLDYKGEYQGVHIYENSNVMKKAFLLKDTEAVKGLDSVIEKLQNGFDFRKTALIEDIGMNIRNNKEAEEESVRINQYSANRISLEVQSKKEGLLVLSDLYYPGWKARVNGKEEKIVKVFGLFRAVPINEGNNKVLFYYMPQSAYVGAIVSVSMLIICILFVCRKRKR